MSLDWTATPEAADLAAAHQVEVSAEIEFDQFTRDPSATFSSSDLTAKAVVVNVESGVEMVSVSWIEPQATDNIGIASIEANFRPGDNFTWIDSPYEIVYTAYDFSEQQAECRFDVIVQPNLNPLSLDTPFRTVFSRSVTIQSGFPYADDLQVLMDPTAAVLSFDSDFDNTTALEVRFVASNNDVIEVRARDDSQYSQVCLMHDLVIARRYLFLVVLWSFARPLACERRLAFDSHSRFAVCAVNQPLTICSLL